MNKHWLGFNVVFTSVLGLTHVAIAQDLPTRIRYAPSPLLAVDQNRTTVIDRIVTQWGDALAESRGAIGALELRAMLATLRSDHLLAASLAGTLDGLRSALLNATPSAMSHEVDDVTPKAIGDGAADLTYTPVNPCRIADTRGAGGALTANVQRQFDGYNVTSFAFQGGTPSSCGMPNGVAAIAMNVYAVNPGNVGFIKVWSASAAEPAVSTVNYQPGIVAIATGAIVPVDGANNNRFLAKSPAAVDFIADVVGYFKAPTAPIPQLASAISDLTARVAKLEGQITAADLAGTYRLTGLQNELQGGVGATSVSSYVFRATLQLVNDGTYTLGAPGTPEGGNTLRFFTNPPSVVAFVGAGMGPPITGNWSYAAGAITLDNVGLVFDVGAAGRLLVGATFNHTDGTNVLLLATRL